MSGIGFGIKLNAVFLKKRSIFVNGLFFLVSLQVKRSIKTVLQQMSEGKIAFIV